MNVIEVRNVSRRFQDVKALQDVNLTIEHGKLYGLLGRNGAGKSTLLNIISNRIFASEGSVLLDDVMVSENDTLQKKIYLMSEMNLYPKNFKVRDVFQYTKQFYGHFDMEYAHRLSELFELNEKKKVATLSTGYTSIFKLITALALDIPFVFFDEPVLGLDANHRDLFYKQLIDRYVQTQNTYVISTHLIDEIANLIEDVIILKDGEVIEAQPCASFLETGFGISGKASEVDEFIKGKHVLGSDCLGGLKTAYLLEDRKHMEIPETLEVSGLDLQKLFIQLTNSQKEKIL